MSYPRGLVHCQWTEQHCVLWPGFYEPANNKENNGLPDIGFLPEQPALGQMRQIVRAVLSGWGVIFYEPASHQLIWARLLPQAAGRLIEELDLVNWKWNGLVGFDVVFDPTCATPTKQWLRSDGIARRMHSSSITKWSPKYWAIKNKANLRDLIAVTGLVILLKLDSNRRFFSPCDIEIWWMTPKNNRAPLLYYFKVFASFQIHQCIQTGVAVRKRPILVKIDDFFSRVTLPFDVWPWKTIGHLFYAASSFVHHFVAIGEFKLEL